MQGLVLLYSQSRWGWVTLGLSDHRSKIYQKSAARQKQENLEKLCLKVNVIMAWGLVLSYRAAMPSSNTAARLFRPEVSRLPVNLSHKTCTTVDWRALLLPKNSCTWRNHQKSCLRFIFLQGIYVQRTADNLFLHRQISRHIIK